MAPRLAKLPSVVGLLITDDGVDLAANEVAEIEWMRTHTPELWPWVNQCGDGTDWLARAGTPYAVPELYAVPGRPLNASEVVKAAAAQLGGYDHWLSESERFGLLHFPLNIGDGGDTGLVRSTSLVRFQAYAALAYGAKGLNRGTAGATARGTSPPTRRRPSTPSSKKLTSASTLVAGRRRCWRRPGRARSTRDGRGQSHPRGRPLRVRWSRRWTTTFSRACCCWSRPTAATRRAAKHTASIDASTSVLLLVVDKRLSSELASPPARVVHLAINPSLATTIERRCLAAIAPWPAPASVPRSKAVRACCCV